MRRERSLEFWFSVAAAVAFSIAYIFVDFNKLCALRVGSNTGEYLQAAIRFVHSGSTFNYVDWNSTLAMHDQWMFLVVAPLAAIWPRPETVIVLQVTAIAAAAPLLYLLVRAWGGTRPAALAVAIVYLLSPSVQGFANAEFVPLDFVPALATATLLCLAHGYPWAALFFIELLCGTKEDVAMFVVWFGLAYAVLQKRRFGVAAAALAGANLVVYYVTLGSGGQSVHPSYGFDDAAWPKQLAFLAEIMAPFAFAPLALGWRVVFAAPLVVELFFARWAFPLYQAGSYYTIALVTAIALASAYVVARRPQWARAAVVLAVVMALFFNTTVLHFGRRLYTCDPLYRIAKAWGSAGTQIDFPCEDQGAWTVAAANVQARLFDCGEGLPLRRARATWSNDPLVTDAAWRLGPQDPR